MDIQEFMQSAVYRCACLAPLYAIFDRKRIVFLLVLLTIFITLHNEHMPKMGMVAGLAGFATRGLPVMHWALLGGYALAVANAHVTAHCKDPNGDDGHGLCDNSTLWGPLHVFALDGCNTSLAAEQLKRGFVTHMSPICECDAQEACVVHEAHTPHTTSTCAHLAEKGFPFPVWKEHENVWPLARKIWMVRNGMQAQAHNSMFVSYTPFLLARHLLSPNDATGQVVPSLKRVIFDTIVHPGLLAIPSSVVMFSVVLSLPARLLVVGVMHHLKPEYRVTNGGLEEKEKHDEWAEFYEKVVFITSPMPWIIVGFFVLWFYDLKRSNSWKVQYNVMVWGCFSFLCVYCFNTPESRASEWWLVWPNLLLLWLMCLMQASGPGHNYHNQVGFVLKKNEFVFLFVLACLGHMFIMQARNNPLI